MRRGRLWCGLARMQWCPHGCHGRYARSHEQAVEPIRVMPAATVPRLMLRSRGWFSRRFPTRRSRHTQICAGRDGAERVKHIARADAVRPSSTTWERRCSFTENDFCHQLRRADAAGVRNDAPDDHGAGWMLTPGHHFLPLAAPSSELCLGFCRGSARPRVRGPWAPPAVSVAWQASLPSTKALPQCGRRGLYGEHVHFDANCRRCHRRRNLAARYGEDRVCYRGPELRPS